MTRQEIVAALPDHVNVSARRLVVDGQPGWLIAWGTGLPRRSIMVQDASLTPESLRERVENAGS